MPVVILKLQRLYKQRLDDKVQKCGEVIFIENE